MRSPLPRPAGDQSGATGVSPSGGRHHQAVEFGGVHRGQGIAQPHVEDVQQFDGGADRSGQADLDLRTMMAHRAEHVGHLLAGLDHPRKVQRNQDHLIDAAVGEGANDLRTGGRAGVGEGEVYRKSGALRLHLVAQRVVDLLDSGVHGALREKDQRRSAHLPPAFLFDSLDTGAAPLPCHHGYCPCFGGQNANSISNNETSWQQKGKRMFRIHARGRHARQQILRSAPGCVQDRATGV